MNKNLSILLVVFAALILTCALFVFEDIKKQDAPDKEQKKYKMPEKLISTEEIRRNNNSIYPTVEIKGKILVLEIADSPSAMTRGLSGRDELPDGSGMLFIFPNPQKLSFWMKDMRFALDFIWIRDGIIIEATENVLPPKYGAKNEELEIYSAKEPVDMVLEVSAGFVADLGGASELIGEQIDLFGVFKEQ